MSVYQEKEYEEYKNKFKEEYFRYMSTAANFGDLSKLPAFSLNLDSYINSKLNMPYKNDEEHLIFSVHGCAGTTDKSQKCVADALKKDKKIQFNLLLGDNVYPGGIQTGSSSDKDIISFINKFYSNIYGNLLSFCILGNHDYNYWGHADSILATGWRREQGPNVAIRQVKASYIDACSNVWQMPYRYYALFSPSSSSVFFMLDSNTFLWDINQRRWLFEAYNAFKDKKLKFLVLHHPLITVGKRGHEGEHIKMYKKFLNGIDTKTILKTTYDCRFDDDKNPIGLQIHKIIARMGFSFNIVLCAHDHFLDIRLLNNGSVQCTSGSAGESRHAPWNTKDKYISSNAVQTNAEFINPAYDSLNVNMKGVNGYFKVTVNRGGGKCKIDIIEATSSKLLNQIIL